MGKQRKQVRASLKYARHAFAPEDLLNFVATSVFTREWEKLGLDDEHDLCALQLMIMANPKGPPVVTGTDGLRKLRFAPVKWNTGTSGGARVCYVYFEDFGIVLLVVAYDKHARDDLSDPEKKAVR